MQHPLDVNIFDMVSVEIPAPAAGSPAGLGIPGQTRILIVAATFRLVTDANGANRTVHMRFTDGTNTILEIGSPAVQTASITRDYNFAIGIGSPYVGATDDERVVPLPSELYLVTGWDTVINVENIQAGDQLSEIFFTYQRWVHPI